MKLDSSKGLFAGSPLPSPVSSAYDNGAQRLGDRRAMGFQGRHHAAERAPRDHRPRADPSHWAPPRAGLRDMLDALEREAPAPTKR